MLWTISWRGRCFFWSTIAPCWETVNPINLPCLYCHESYTVLFTNSTEETRETQIHILIQLAETAEVNSRHTVLTSYGYLNLHDFSTDWDFPPPLHRRTGAKLIFEICFTRWPMMEIRGKRRINNSSAYTSTFFFLFEILLLFASTANLMSVSVSRHRAEPEHHGGCWERHY